MFVLDSTTDISLDPMSILISQFDGQAVMQIF